MSAPLYDRLAAERDHERVEILREKFEWILEEIDAWETGEKSIFDAIWAVRGIAKDLPWWSRQRRAS